ncbi:hypothetical protein SMQE32_46520 [Serratia marcescens]|jgi:uncharacterized protein YjhX (UPF0386 family)|uniref:Uncharacterized protein n=1 Tax=Serratia ureilytica TaxID=300181 RepID=A0ABU0VIM6_9GAMM|nr:MULTISPECIES: hypothetical protein [Serratia]KAB5493382.1 hypothetical protein F8564_23690 [Enterobacter sp. RJAL6]KLE39951.1 hypothetical protein ABA78_03100 [Serratia sp. TEL]ALD44260.1 hypothetical protein AN479_07435 [Serratia marcescens]AUO01590.1 hypothetical protein C0558_07260 [Serratia marcescens]EMD1304797.1 hypothetical protein [Serratia marcescens]
MTQRAIVSVANYVHQLAKDHEITHSRDGMSRMAVAITGLADDAVELDEVEQLLVNLKRKGILTKSEILSLQGRYFREQRAVRKKFKA